MHPNQVPYEAFVDVQMTYDQLIKIQLSPLQDGFLLIHSNHPQGQPVDPKAGLPRPILIECKLKTELLWALDKTMAKKMKRNLPLEFIQQFQYQVEASGFMQRKGLKKTAPRTVVFQEGGLGGHQQMNVDTKSKKYFMIVNVATGAPAKIMPQESNRPMMGGRPQQRPQNQPMIQSGIYGGQNQAPQQQRAPQQQFRPQFHKPPQQHHQPADFPSPPGSMVHHQQQQQHHHAAPQFRPPGMNRGRLPSGKDQSAPAPHRDQSIRNNFANIMMQNQQQRPMVDDLPVLPDAVNQMQIRQQQSQRPRMPPKPRPAPKPKTSPKARVLYDYQAGDNDEITLAEGEQVEILKEDPNGWFMVRKGGSSGLFPGNYLEKISP